MDFIRINKLIYPLSAHIKQCMSRNMRIKLKNKTVSYNNKTKFLEKKMFVNKTMCNLIFSFNLIRIKLKWDVFPLVVIIQVFYIHFFQNFGVGVFFFFCLRAAAVGYLTYISVIYILIKINVNNLFYFALWVENTFFLSSGTMRFKDITKKNDTLEFSINCYCKEFDFKSQSVKLISFGILFLIFIFLIFYYKKRLLWKKFLLTYLKQNKTAAP